MAQLNIRIDDELKNEGDRLFRDLGLSFSSAVSIFVSQGARACYSFSSNCAKTN